MQNAGRFVMESGVLIGKGGLPVHFNVKVVLLNEAKCAIMTMAHYPYGDGEVVHKIINSVVSYK